MKLLKIVNGRIVGDLRNGIQVIVIVAVVVIAVGTRKIPFRSKIELLILVVFVDERNGQRVDDGVESAGGADEQVVQRHVVRQHHRRRGQDEKVKS